VFSQTITSHQFQTQGHIQRQHGLELRVCGIDSLWAIFEVVNDITIRERVMYLLALAYTD
jgi:hypothetical protein